MQKYVCSTLAKTHWMGMPKTIALYSGMEGGANMQVFQLLLYLMYLHVDIRLITESLNMGFAIDPFNQKWASSS